MSRPLSVLLIVLACSLPSRATFGHPKHESIAEVEWNAKTERLEVALRLRPEDIEEALTRMLRSESRVNLDATPKVDQHLMDYLRPRFVVRLPKASKRQPLRWVGKEVDLRYAWIYFEIDLPARSAGKPVDCKIAATVLMDVLPDQVNTLLLTVGDKKSSLQFSRAKPIHAWPASNAQNVIRN